MSNINPQIEESWKLHLSEEFAKTYFSELKTFLVNEKSKGLIVFPPGQQIFNAFNLCPFDKVKVVIIGQDPYHGRGQAHGLCFSVQDGVKPPPSLVNIYKEIEDDLGIKMNFAKGNLEGWAKQGVFLLNAILTVRENQPASHQGKGWETFTDAVIKELSDNRIGLVFLLWGKYAQSKESLIDKTEHFILKAAHPSPFSAYNGFIGCKHFSKADEILRNQGLEEINWQIT
jgi:uracil-DNA glycosylase